MADGDLDFDKMFDELAKMTDEPASTPKPVIEEEPKPVIVGEEPPAPVETPVPAIVGEEPPAPVETPVPATVAEAPAPAPTPEPEPRPVADDVLARIADALSKRTQPEPAPQPQPAPAEQPLYTQEETAALAAYEKDWPDVAKAEAIRRRAEYQQLLGYVFQQVSQRFAPLEQAVQGVGTRSHINDLYTLIPDYDQVRDPVIEWVGKQPAYIKAAYDHVVQQGSPEEIADLVSRYKQANGIVTPAAPAPQARQPTPAVKQAAAKLAPVQSSRTSPTGQATPEDFDGAFSAFAKSI